MLQLRSLGRFILGLLLLSVVPPLAANDVIPRPLHTEPATQSGTLVPLPKGPISYASKCLAPEAAYLKDKLGCEGYERKLRFSRKLGHGILLRVDSTLSGGPEAYRLESNASGVTLTGASRAGVFYAIQTLLSSLTPQGMLPAETVTDAPRYPWRGIMLDESRHFFGRGKVEQMLDLMARFKLNKFHWHLTDEPGWRIEIKRYPRLTEEGSRGNWSNMADRTPCFYTQEDIRAIVAYAAERHIEIIPEIDMPGHATAATRAYPILSGGGTKEHPDFTFNVGRDTVYTFLTYVLREVTELFPSPYLHLGGDEVAFGIEAWKTDPDIQALMKREGFTDVKQAERYFMFRMADSVRVLGKQLIGWDELLDFHMNTSETLIQWWRHDRVQSLKACLAEGYSTILCPRRPLYFDFIQHSSHHWGRVWNGFCPLEDVYAFPDAGMKSWQLTNEQLSHILGLQANVWTERIHTPERLDFMLFPRLCAVAESGWTRPEYKDYSDFTRRMERVYTLLDKLRIYYFDPRDPNRHAEPVGAQRKEVKVPMDFRD